MYLHPFRQSPLDGTEFHALNICPDIEKVLEFEAEMWPFDPFGSTSIRHGRAALRVAQMRSANQSQIFSKSSLGFQTKKIRIPVDHERRVFFSRIVKKCETNTGLTHLPSFLQTALFMIDPSDHPSIHPTHPSIPSALIITAWRRSRRACRARGR